MNKIEKLAGEYNSTFARLAVIESELTKECQKYVSWDTVQVSITGGGAPIVKARNEIDAVPLEDPPTDIWLGIRFKTKPI